MILSSELTNKKKETSWVQTNLPSVLAIIMVIFTIIVIFKIGSLINGVSVSNNVYINSVLPGTIK